MRLSNLVSDCFFNLMVRSVQEILHNSGRGPLSNVTTCCIPKPSLRCLVGNYLVSTNTMSATNSAQDLHNYPETQPRSSSFEPNAQSSRASASAHQQQQQQQQQSSRPLGCASTCFGRLRKRVQESSLEDDKSKPFDAHYRYHLGNSVQFYDICWN